jgi:hypothetical protein
MNKLTLKLAKESGISFWGHPMNPLNVYPSQLEKFAELIVRECCEQLVKEGEAWEQFSRNPPEGQETNTGAALFAAYRLKEDAVSRLEEHFGVE